MPGDRVDLGLGNPGPWIRTGLLAPIGRNKPSPWPTSFSAPFWSRITRESASEDVAKANRDGTFALISPVTMSTDGRWVASTRWMPAARASWVMRTIASSTSRGATIIRSANSSTITSRYGYGVNVRSLPGGALTRPARTALLKSSRWRKPKWARSSYRMSISRTTQPSASAARLGLVMIGVIRCGMPSYAVSSTRLGRPGSSGPRLVWPA